MVMLLNACDNGSMNVHRLYIMHLENRPLEFSVLTHHANVTQCLGSVGGHVWYIAVAKPSVRDPDEIKGDAGASVRQSHSGHFDVPPAVEDVRVFRISGPKFLKLNHGTWHNGPLFMANYMDFYNLELTNTNVSFPHPRSLLCKFLVNLLHLQRCSGIHFSLFMQ